MNTTALTIRVKSPLYQQAKHLAKREGKSLNAWVQKVLAEKIAAEEQKELYDAFTALGKDTELSNVESYWQAQREVVLGQSSD